MGLAIITLNDKDVGTDKAIRAAMGYTKVAYEHSKTSAMVLNHLAVRASPATLFQRFTHSSDKLPEARTRKRSAAEERAAAPFPGPVSIWAAAPKWRLDGSSTLKQCLERPMVCTKPRGRLVCCTRRSVAHVP
jgi:hypothetical protein